MKVIVAALLVVSTLAGCAVYTPDGAVVVGPQVKTAPAGGGGFCPPGQAKKGNC